MELRQLETFVAVARRKNFTRAAAELHLTQPAVTRQIAALEAELKTPLFDRVSRSVRLTAAGDALLPYAQTVLRLIDEARQTVAEVAGGASGRIVVGASSTLATYVLPPLLSSFRACHPGLEIAIRTGVSAKVVSMVRDGAVDLGLVTTDGPALSTAGGRDSSGESALIWERVSAYETCLVVPVAHRLAGRKSVDVAELAGEPLLLMEPGANLRVFADHLLAAAKVLAPPTMELDSVEAIKRMVEAGLGVAFLPRIAITQEMGGSRSVALALSGVAPDARSVALIWRADKHRATAERAFADALRTLGR